MKTNFTKHFIGIKEDVNLSNEPFDDLEALGFKKGNVQFHRKDTNELEEFKGYSLGNVYINIETKEVIVLANKNVVDSKDLETLFKLISSDYVCIYCPPTIELSDFQKECLRRYKEKHKVNWIARDNEKGELYGYSKNPTCFYSYTIPDTQNEFTKISEDITTYPIVHNDGILNIDDLIQERGE